MATMMKRQQSPKAPKVASLRRMQRSSQASAPPPSAQPAIVQLQSQFSNRAVASLFRSHRMQAQPSRNIAERAGCIQRKIANSVAPSLIEQPLQKPNFTQSISSPVDQFIILQKTIGNQVVQRLVENVAGPLSGVGGQIQSKLEINQPGDKYEQEADRVADEVMRMPEPAIQRKPT